VPSYDTRQMLKGASLSVVLYNKIGGIALIKLNQSSQQFIHIRFEKLNSAVSSIEP